MKISSILLLIRFFFPFLFPHSIRQQHLSRVISDHMSSSPYTQLKFSKDPSTTASTHPQQQHHHGLQHLSVKSTSTKRSGRSLAHFDSCDSGESSSSNAPGVAPFNVLASPLRGGGGGGGGEGAQGLEGSDDLESLCGRFEETVSIVVGFIQEDVSLMSSSGIFR